MIYFAEFTQTEQRVAERLMHVGLHSARALRLTEGMCAGKEGKF